MHNKILSHMLLAEQFCFIILQTIIINFILNIAPSLGILSLMLSLLYDKFPGQELSFIQTLAQCQHLPTDE